MCSNLLLDCVNAVSKFESERSALLKQVIVRAVRHKVAFIDVEVSACVLNDDIKLIFQRVIAPAHFSLQLVYLLYLADPVVRDGNRLHLIRHFRLLSLAIDEHVGVGCAASEHLL